jgi:GNAT superfamily N-acetyltransferase
MAGAIAVETLSGAALDAALPDLARLRITVFRAFPYLYDGTEAYEAGYLRSFAQARDAIIAAARDGAGRIVGCATGSALDDHHPEFAAALTGSGLDPSRVFYCAESVLLPDYRGHGLGHAFFDAREAHAGALGYEASCFCAVIRPADHPMKPADYSPLDAFWRRRGYAPVEGAVASFSWKDTGEAEETAKLMQMWMRAL